MHPKCCSTSILFLFIIFVFVDSQHSVRYDDKKFQNCSLPFECGPTNITYPFWGNRRIQDSGRPGFQLKCQHNSILIEIKSENYRVLPIDGGLVLFVQMNVFDSCPVAFVNDPFNPAPSNQYLTFLFNCSQSPSPISYYNFTCPQNDVTNKGSYLEESNQSCMERILVPFLLASSDDLQQGLLSKKTGQCGYDWITEEHVCFYRQPKSETKSGNNTKLQITAAIAASAVGTGVLLIIVYCFKRRFPTYKFILFWKKNPQNDQNVEAFFRNYAPLVPKKYNYSEVKKMTNSFGDKLGQGGYGGVYKGKLNDGSLVAVKVLNESKGNGEEFINEVASVSRTSHVNIVTLLGFCFEGSKTALIYEFMPNGSLEKFIYGKTPEKADCLLGWETLYRIAIGIAQGLEYLHRGCNTRILHFDIKPHNILLDEEFCPKISDFGLAKICTRKESIISMLGARGTAGYIAPEVFCRNFGGVSHKSDVYSYGMMVLEMVGGRKNICFGVDCTSEIYFPQWICKRLELGEELELHGVRDEEEKKITRKMILVGLWCIQTDPSNRPSMSRVVEMLQGSLESLPIPPTPFLSSDPLQEQWQIL